MQTGTGRRVVIGVLVLIGVLLVAAWIKGGPRAQHVVEFPVENPS